MEKVHDAKTAMIGVNNPYPVIERDDHMVMGARASVSSTRFKIELAQILRMGAAPQNGKTPGHPEMDQEAMAIIKVNQNIFGPAAEPQDLPALQSGRKIRWKWKAKTRPPKVHIGNGTPDENRN